MVDTIKPPSMLGILGGGQLGRFFVISAQKMGYKVTVLDPDKNSPAGNIADIHLCASYQDTSALDSIKKTCAAVTIEFENIPATTLEYLETDMVVRPSSKAVSIVQNRIYEKTFLKNNNFPVGPFIVISDTKSLDLVTNDMYPAILKIAQFGYDGKGQTHVNDRKELELAFDRFDFKPCILEKKLSLQSEVSVVLARNSNGEKANFPVIENQHISGILDVSIAPARVSNSLCIEAIHYAEAIATKLNYIGVIAIEFFISNENIYINEVAPRPHNSGHHSLDSCDINQFDQQVFALTDAPLNNPKLITSAVMVNLLGDIWFKEGKLNPPNFEIFEKFSKEVLHMYGKKEARQGRKMGHFTVTGNNTETNLMRAKKIRSLLSKNENKE
ncbi:5-(carboxyamino)imidazole ribonucleotide synthase [Methylophilaceae bacterium]|nr:5-(carboxyamino)imidazole ribonucleotide synthase [Methylophilaceae bacterium]